MLRCIQLSSHCIALVTMQCNAMPCHRLDHTPPTFEPVPERRRQRARLGDLRAPLEQPLDDICARAGRALDGLALAIQQGIRKPHRERARGMRRQGRWRIRISMRARGRLTPALGRWQNKSQGGEGGRERVSEKVSRRRCRRRHRIYAASSAELAAPPTPPFHTRTHTHTLYYTTASALGDSIRAVSKNRFDPEAE